MCAKGPEERALALLSETETWFQDRWVARLDRIRSGSIDVHELQHTTTYSTLMNGYSAKFEFTFEVTFDRVEMTYAREGKMHIAVDLHGEKKVIFWRDHRGRVLIDKRSRAVAS